MRATAPLISFRTIAGLVALCLVGPAAGQDTGLAEAARAGDWSEVSALIDRAAAVDFNGPDGTAAIHYAVQSRRTDIVRDLIGAGANLDASNRFGVSALSLAARDGNAELLEVLLGAGADPAAAEAALPEGQTLAMLAARTGRVAALETLNAHAALDVSAREQRNHTTVLFWAALDDRGEAIAYLSRLGANPDARSRLTEYPHLGNGVLLTPPEDGVTYAGQTPLQNGGWTALMYAARSGAAAAVRALAEAGADLNALDPLGESALTLAIINGHWRVVEALLVAGADPNVADLAGSTPLYAAVDFHSLPETYGRPAPKPRIVYGAVTAAERLLQSGARVDAPLTGTPLRRQYTAGDGRLRAGATPLMRAAAAADATMMRVLFDGGANSNARADNGMTALLLAASSARGEPGSPDHIAADQALEAARLVLEFGGDVSATDSRGQTAAHLAVGKPGAAAMLQLLADHGVALDIADERGRTPLDLALDRDAPDEASVELLRRLSSR